MHNSFNNQQIKDLAIEHKFTRRASKLSAEKFLELLMFSNLENRPASLNDFSAYLSDEYDLQISKQAIDYRFNQEAVDFLKSVLELQMKNTVELSKLSTVDLPFKSIRIKDSTRWNLPDNCVTKYQGHGGCRANSKSMISVQYDYDLLNGDTFDLAMTNGRRNDMADSRQVTDNISANELLLRDLGYVSTTYLKNIIAKQAYFLNRLPPQLGVYSPKDQSAISFKEINQQFKKHQNDHMELDVLLGSEHMLNARLVIFKAPKRVYDQRIAKARKAAKKKGHDLSKEYKARAAYSSFITNADSDKIDAQTVQQLYKIRWQIELKFKVWKSLININDIVKMKVERFEAQLLAKFIWLLINWKAFLLVNHWMYHQNHKKLCSIWKFFKQIKRKPLVLRNILIKLRKKTIKKWLTKLFKKAHKNLSIEERKGKLPLYQILNRFFQLA